MATRDNSSLASITVLVVDDQDYVRSIVAQLLRRLGIGDILEAGTASDAIEILRHNQPDIMLCDIRMEPMDGLQLLQKVRGGECGDRHDIPVIFLTSASDRLTIQSAMENNVDGYLVKPVSADELRSKISAVLARQDS